MSTNDTTTHSKKIDYSYFKSNNFKKVSDNEIINEIETLGGAIWLNIQGDICIRAKKDNIYKSYTTAKASMVLNNLLTKPIKIECKKSLDETKGTENTIHISELLLVEDEVFNPSKQAEFYEEDGSYYLNTFKPSKYLMLGAGEYKEPETILRLIYHLVNSDNERFNYVLNWLAYFFQTLDKSQVAILFKGTQGAGKGTFFNIIKKLFGEAYCVEINGDTLKSNYLGSLIENTLFLNFDEISYRTIGKSSFGSFLKAIITNSEVTSEKKNVNLEKPIKLYAQTILFSNVENPIEIEESDRRFTVFTTGCNLALTNFLGCNSFSKMEEAIEQELADFAMFLKNYNVNSGLANSVFFTPEKASMIDTTDRNLQSFVWAMKSKQIPYFYNLQMINFILYQEFIHNILSDRVKQKHLIIVYNALFPQDHRIRSSRSLFKHLETFDPAVFGSHNLHKSDGDKYYQLF